MKRFMLFICIATSITYHSYSKYTALASKAVCKVPVADLLGNPMALERPKSNINASYRQLPLAHKDSPSTSLRVHQLLFNEVVTVKEVRNQEVLIELPHVFYQTNQGITRQTCYWTLKSNIIPLELVQPHLKAIPHPLTTDKDDLPLALNNTVALTQPWYDPVTKVTYAAGTRFICNDKPTAKGYSITLIDWQKKKAVASTVPHTYALTYHYAAPEDHIKQFVTLIKSWAHHNDGFIPYVLGGCSIVNYCTEHNFNEIPYTDGNGKQGIVFTKSELEFTSPKTGLDCTGLVVRAAQIAGIPYFFKNSSTVINNLAEITPEDTLNEGDLIWIPGHVMVVSNIEKGLLIEARHYYHGYGKVHEIPLKEQFQGITTYQALLDALFKKKTLIRLNKDGRIAHLIPTFKILKLASAWQPIKSSK